MIGAKLIITGYQAFMVQANRLSVAESDTKLKSGSRLQRLGNGVSDVTTCM